MTPIEILHLEDSASDAELISRVLRREWSDCAIRHVTRAEDYRAALSTHGFDVILSDYSMPGYDGLMALAEARRQAPETPFLFLSGMIGEERAVDALKRGATDYILKDRPARLVPAIRQALAFVAESTRRRDSEEALRAKEERYRLITENIGDLITVLNLDGRASYHNEASRRLLRVETEEDENWYRHLDPQDLLRVRRGIDRVVCTGQPERFEFRYRLIDGSSRHMAARAAVLRNAQGNVTHALVLARDVTERRQSEARLREQASLLDKASDAIYATDLDGRIRYWNASAERLYGPNAVDAIGHTLAELGIGADAERLAIAHKALLAAGEWRGELHMRTATGRSLLVESSRTLVRSEGESRSVLTIDTDVTERKKLEAQLLRAQRLESIGTLAGGVAHDLNNVFTPVVLTLDLLAPKATSPEERQVLEKTRMSVAHGAALVRQLLAFARGGEGERSRVDLRTSLAGVEPLIRQWLPPTIDLQVRHPQPPWPVDANLTQLHQALINLALNARDAMPHGGRLEIVTENVQVDAGRAAANPGTSPGPFVRVSVFDSGCGMPSEIADRIFDPFFTTKGPGKGTGLGLAMVAGILKNHGGFVQVESEPERGTTFHLFFPAASSPSPAPAKAAPAKEPETQRGRGILLIDDEPAIRDALGALLQRAGYRVHTAGDCRSGLETFEAQRDDIDLVITDMMLPDGSGVDVVKTLRSRDSRLPIMAISGMMASGQFDELLQLHPPVQCLPKPLTPRVLLGAAARALECADSVPVAGGAR